MKLLIEIPKEDYELRKRIASRHGAMNMVNTAIANGKPLDSVLDKIRAEIEALGTWRDKLFIETVDIRLVLDIIDKYKAGSEDKNGDCVKVGETYFKSENAKLKSENAKLKAEIARLKDEALWDKYPEPGH